MSHVLLGTRWARDQVLTVGDTGEILAIESAPQFGSVDAARSANSDLRGGVYEAISGFVVPGMPNAHSHAFQRAMAGIAEVRESSDDSFWSWRGAMYSLANRVSPHELQIIARQLFIEMLKAGYTSVAEFHYLHQQADGAAYPEPHALYRAVDEAATETGIGLTLLPTLYLHSDFGNAALRPEQQRFSLSVDEFVRRIEARAAKPALSANPTPFARIRTGAAFHSLRAVDMASLREAHRQLMRIDRQMPIHIHVSEQLREVEACVQHTGQRPIDLLLATGLVDEHWCLVHATHADAREREAAARAGAIVCLCITTEGNLGDGEFEAKRFLDIGGRFCVGSDSQITVDPSEELRWLEYQHRLRSGRRAALASDSSAHVGTRLWAAAATAGAVALGQPVGELAVGRRADWLVLDADHPSLLSGAPEFTVDQLVFAGARAAIRDVMVAGAWVLKNRVHAGQSDAAAEFVGLMRRFAVT